MESKRLIRTDIILLTAGLLLLGYLLGEVLLLVFAAVLLAVGLDGLARAIAGRLPLSRGWALVGLQENADVGSRKAGRWWPPGHGGLGETSRHLEGDLEHAVTLV